MLKAEGDSTGIDTAATGSAWPSWCDSCRSLPCSVYCRADAAYLCGGCDAAVHSANSLARRHHRVLLLPVPSVGPRQFMRRQEEVTLMEEEEEDEGGEEDGLFLGGEVDEYLDLVEFSSCEEEVKSEEKEKQINGCESIDGIVPVRCLAADQEELQLLQSFQMGYEAIKGEVAYTDSVVHNVALSSLEATGMSSTHMIRTSKGSIHDLFSGTPLQMPHQFTPMDREARVLRYREKRKTRKFQKIIRYASRKAYAETRPRIKGRFAKRTDVELEVDQMFAAPVMAETNYGVVPSY